MLQLYIKGLLVVTMGNFFPMFQAKQGFVNLQWMEYYKQSAFVNLPMARDQTETAQVRWLKCRIWLKSDSQSLGGPGHRPILKLLR